MDFTFSPPSVSTDLDVFLVAISLFPCDFKSRDFTAIPVQIAAITVQIAAITIFQGRKRKPNPNFLVRISSGGVGVFHVKGWGPKSSVCPLKPGEIELFWRDIPGFCRDNPEVPEKFEKKWFVFNFWPLILQFGHRRAEACKHSPASSVNPGGRAKSTKPIHVDIDVVENVSVENLPPNGLDWKNGRIFGKIECGVFGRGVFLQ